MSFGFQVPGFGLHLRLCPRTISRKTPRERRERRCYRRVQVLHSEEGLYLRLIDLCITQHQA